MFLCSDDSCECQTFLPFGHKVLLASLYVKLMWFCPIQVRRWLPWNSCLKIAIKSCSSNNQMICCFFWFTVACRLQVNWNQLKKRPILRQDSPKLRFYLFFSKNICMTIKPLKIAEQIIFMDRQISLSKQTFKTIPYKEEKYKLTRFVIFVVLYIMICSYILSVCISI